MNFKYFRHSLTTCAYNPCSIAIFLMLFFNLKWCIMSFICIILTFFKYKIIWKSFIFLLKIWFYNFVDCPPLSCIYFVSLLNCVNIFNINFHCLFISFGLLFIFDINFRLVARLGFCGDGLINICLFSHRQIFSI